MNQTRIVRNCCLQARVMNKLVLKPTFSFSAYEELPSFSAWQVKYAQAIKIEKVIQEALNSKPLLLVHFRHFMSSFLPIFPQNCLPQGLWATFIYRYRLIFVKIIPFLFFEAHDQLPPEFDIVQIIVGKI